jgi:hypothetical protein
MRVPILEASMSRDPEYPLEDPLRTEEFDALVRVLLPTVQARSPELSAIEALREAARVAEARMRETAWITWGRPRL